MPLGRPVTIRCQGPPGADLYRLEKLKSGRYFDQAEIFISEMKRDQAGRYRCSYQIGMRWSPPSSQLELVATGNRGWAGLDVESQGCEVLCLGDKRVRVGG